MARATLVDLQAITHDIIGRNSTLKSVYNNKVKELSKIGEPKLPNVVFLKVFEANTIFACGLKNQIQFSQRKARPESLSAAKNS